MYVQIAVTLAVVFDWDEDRNQIDIEKHGLSFDEAKHVFASLHLSRIDAREDYGEDREITIGMIVGSIVTVVVHTDRDETIRIIAARKANKRERNDYHAYCAQEIGASTGVL